LLVESLLVRVLSQRGRLKCKLEIAYLDHSHPKTHGGVEDVSFENDLSHSASGSLAMPCKVTDVLNNTCAGVGGSLPFFKGSNDARLWLMHGSY